jgi:cation diffusion facilitator family transporter
LSRRGFPAYFPDVLTDVGEAIVGHEQSHHGARLRHAITPHSHHGSTVVDATLTDSREGMRALWISFAGLLVTAGAQAAVVAQSGSIALVGDTLHNLADALTAVPLGIAFALARRAATRRFTYGFGRSEDLAGLLIVAVIAASAVLTCWQAIQRLIHPYPVHQLGWVAAAGLLGFAGNEIVARYRIRTGRQIGSAALVADGRHARTDGYTSLAVLVSAGGAAVGWWWADPVIGLIITGMILATMASSAGEVFGRLLDAVDPALVVKAEEAITTTPGVHKAGQVRMRWIGHSLHAETEIEVGPELTLDEAHRIAHAAEHHMLHALPRLRGAIIHAHPAEHDRRDYSPDSGVPSVR